MNYEIHKNTSTLWLSLPTDPSLRTVIQSCSPRCLASSLTFWAPTPLEASTVISLLYFPVSVT
ncbi:hypothetical protein DPMN_066579 [Dreissena polymorpha]|uniref:Uncharacterized protein n=1 Tax=Dreissena polymorpha TaxID=45954 RepID=A0A9D3YVR4_DREPO|nr:hypothetical protein DPMN_066579 [Dreissena polymorpha]